MRSYAQYLKTNLAKLQMSYFLPPYFDGVTDHFVDKTDVYLSLEHRFYKLACALASYQGADVLPITDNNELITGRLREQVTAEYNALISTHPTPHACVLILLTDEATPRVLLTLRASNLSSHAGEVAFVGGKRDANDATSYDVATREASEEVGLKTRDTTLIGYLPMQLSKNGLLVRPVVACISPDTVHTLTPSEDEIAQVFWVDMTLLSTPPTNHIFDRMLNDKHAQLHTPAWYGHDGQIIWGLTGRILANLMHIGYGVVWPWYYRIHYGQNS